MVGQTSPSSIEWLTGPYPPGESTRRARLLAVFTLVLGFVGGSFGVINLLTVSVPIGLGQISCAVLVLMAIPVLKFGRSIQVSGHFLMLLLTLVLFYFGRVKGGLVSTTTVFTPSIVFLAVLIVGVRGGLFWALVGTAGMIIHYRLDDLGIMVADRPLNRVLYAATAATSFVIFWGFAQMFESSRRKAFAALETKNAQIEAQHRRAVALSEAVRGRNEAMRRILDNVDQGFVTIDAVGVMEEEHSKVIATWFGRPEPGMALSAYIGRVDPGAAELLALGLDQLADAVLPLELSLAQLPKRFRNGPRTYSLAYLPIVDEPADNDAVSRLLVVITDLTATLEREAIERRQQEQLALFQHIMKDRGGFFEFLEETGRLVQNLEADRPRDEMLRDIHTVKGNCALYGAGTVAGLCHEIESELATEGRAVEAIDVERITAAWASFESDVEPLLGLNSTDIIEIPRRDLDRALKAIRDGSISNIEEVLQSWTKEWTNKRLQRVKAQAEALAMRLSKGDVRVVVEGNDLRLDAEKWSPFWRAFVHVLRNSIDHGLEPAGERRAVGKPEQGNLQIQTYVQDDEFVVDVADDGRGIDWKAIADKAAQLGLPTEDTDDLYSALFASGVTTKVRVTELSGRGVGMAAIQHEVDALGGHTFVSSDPGRGTRFQFRVPRTRMH